VRHFGVRASEEPMSRALFWEVIDVVPPNRRAAVAVLPDRGTVVVVPPDRGAIVVAPSERETAIVAPSGSRNVGARSWSSRALPLRLNRR
jgi:hypothetical protein